MTPTTSTTARRGPALAIHLAVLVLAVLPALAGCDATDPDAPRTFTGTIGPVPLFIEDAAGAPPTDAATLVFENRLHTPVVAPDGHQLTLAEFNAPTGTATVECMAAGTQVALDLRGLIPNGVYTIWNVVFDAPGFDPTFQHMVGLGTLGTPDGTQNTFLAAIDGTARITATTPPGTLSMRGEIGGCTLTDAFEWHLVGAYHMDSRTYGPDLGPDGTVVEQFALAFVRP